VGLVCGITPQQLRSIIAHELAHIRRHDYLVNLLQTVVDTFFYFHPAVWFISARIRTLREDCCDDMVIAGGSDAGAYTESLLCVARRALEIRGASALPSSLVLGAVGKPSALRRRVHRMLGGDERRERFASYWPVGFLVVAALLAGVTLHTKMGIAAEARGTASHAVAPKPPQWGEAKDGLRSRVIADKQSFHAGESIPVRLEIENVGKEAREYQTPAAPYNSTLIVLDEDGQPAPYLGGAAQVMVRTGKLEPGQSKELKSFDLADWYYLRKAGRYTVRWPEEIILHGAADDPTPPPQNTASAPFEFDVIADPKLANADGDPIARLLPLMKKSWWLASSNGKPRKLNPGLNHAQVTGRFFALEYHPTGYKKDSGVVWLWLTDEQAAEQVVAGDWPPASKYLGKVDRWHVYIHADDNARRAWANAEEDIKKALSGTPAEGPAEAKAATSGKLQFRLVADEAEKGETEEIPSNYGEQAIRVLKTVALDGRDIERVYAANDQTGPKIGIDFTASGGKKVEKLTRDNINHRLAIIVDGKVLSAPTIRSAISKSLVITGGGREFTAEKVKALIDSINAGLKSEKVGE
jgi:hypothetical protein